MTTFYVCCRNENNQQQQQQQRTDEDVDDSKATSTYSSEQRAGSEDGYRPRSLYAEIERRSQPTSNSGEGYANVTANADDASVIYSQVKCPDANSDKVAPSDTTRHLYENLPSPY